MGITWADERQGGRDQSWAGAEFSPSGGFSRTEPPIFLNVGVPESLAPFEQRRLGSGQRRAGRSIRFKPVS